MKIQKLFFEYYMKLILQCQKSKQTVDTAKSLDLKISSL